MTQRERLIKVGIRPDCADETILWYHRQENLEGLEQYVKIMENHGMEESKP